MSNQYEKTQKRFRRLSGDRSRRSRVVTNGQKHIGPNARLENARERDERRLAREGDED
ncbi:MAG: hypothetical protein WC880_02025 [Candidatus Paceibacterota bacterium]